MAYIIIFIILALFMFGKPDTYLQGHWNTLIDNFEYSPKEFYERLKTELESHGIERIYIQNKNLNTGGAMSRKRLYLRVTWKEYTYDCCCAPFGKGTFFSWWMFTEPTGKEKFFSRIPFIGNYLIKVFSPQTYYRTDTASMFMTYAQNSVLKVVDDITKNKGVRPLTADEKKPVLRDIFKR